MPPPISIIYQVNNRPKSQQDAFIARLLDKNLDSSLYFIRKVHVGKNQEKAQSEKDSHSKNRGGKKTN